MYFTTSCFMTLSRTSNMMLGRNDKSRHPCFVFRLGGKHQSFTVKHDTLCQADVVPFYSSLLSFLIMSKYWILLNFFVLSTWWCGISSIDLWYNRLHWLFLNLKWAYIPGINPIWLWYIFLFIHCWIWFPNILLRISAVTFIKHFGLFFFLYFFRFWDQGNGLISWVGKCFHLLFFLERLFKITIIVSLSVQRHLPV